MFWIVLSFLYGVSMGLIFMWVISEGGVNGPIDWIVAILFMILSPLALAIGFISIFDRGEKFLENVKNFMIKLEIAKKLSKPIEKLSIPIKKVTNYFQKRKDHKEMDEAEDEWKVERLGLK